jgi:hypothetical protein
MVPRARPASNSLPRGNPGDYPKTREGPRQEQYSFIPAYCPTVGRPRATSRTTACVDIGLREDNPSTVLPGRSAVDLAAAVIHDIEESWARGKVVTLLTLDVRGAFDAVLPGRLIRRLRDRGWPPNIMRWVASFISQRSAAVRLHGGTGSIVQTESKLSQGSPTSPILFMLFMRPLFTLGSKERKRARFGYADDISLLAASDSLESNRETLERDSSEIVEWAGLTLNAKKSELIHFIRYALGLGVHRPTNCEGQAFALAGWESFWTGSLPSKAHVTTMAAKAAGHAARIKALGNTVRKAPPRLLRQAVQACVVPGLCYGAEA